MVTAVTSLGRSGLSDWVVQRVTAVVLLAYLVFIVVALFGGDLSYTEWKGLFSQTWVRVFSVAALLSTAMHAWIGLWCISTDYLISHVLRIKVNDYVASKANILRWAFQAVSAIVLFTYVVWGIQIIWG
jgi:succinate dehydrogenase / fumarate reductase membrane anchor subunit